jgi:hypothetical protein
MGKERMTLPNKAKIRNLKQYKDLTDEEFDEVWKEREEALNISPEMLEARVEEGLAELSDDYDMEDMKSNDMIQIRALVLAQIQLEDLEKTAFSQRQNVDSQSVQILEKVNRILGGLRRDISDISNDLQLTRKIRKQSKEASVIHALKDLKSKAHRFYKERMLYVFCPECKMLLSTIWLNYSDESINNIELKCNRCKHVFTQELLPLYETDNKNVEDIVLP